MYEALVSTVTSAYRLALEWALPPKPRVAQHWLDPSRLTWVGLLAEQNRFQLCWSLGQLHGHSSGFDTAGVFHLESSVFPQVDSAALSKALHAVLPREASVLTHALTQLALADVALRLERMPMPMPTSESFCIGLPLKTDLLDQPALTPRWPAAEHARAKFHTALSLIDTALASQLSALFQAPEPQLLQAVRALRIVH